MRKGFPSRKSAAFTLYGCYWDRAGHLCAPQAGTPGRCPFTGAPTTQCAFPGNSQNHNSKVLYLLAPLEVRCNIRTAYDCGWVGRASLNFFFHVPNMFVRTAARKPKGGRPLTRPIIEGTYPAAPRRSSEGPPRVTADLKTTHGRLPTAENVACNN